MPRILVTGATGFLGKPLCRSLSLAGWIVRGTYSTQVPANAQLGVSEWVQLDLARDEIDWEPLLTGVDCVVHASAIAHRIDPRHPITPMEYDRVNHRGTALLAQASKKTGVKRFVFISSIGAITDQSDVMVDEKTPCKPTTPYGRSKLDAEHSLKDCLFNSDTDWVVLRPTLMYGPGNPGNMARLLKLVNLSIPLPLASVENRRSLLYVENMVSAIEHVLHAPRAARETFCVSDNEVVSTPELIKLIALASNRKVKLIRFPLSILKGLAALSGSFQRLTSLRTGFDTDAIRKITGSLFVSTGHLAGQCGWTPRFSMREGLSKTFMPPRSDS